MEFIKYALEGRLGYITLNRPEKRNAFNDQLVSELKQALKLAEKDERAKVVVIRAEGKAFSAGADLAVLRSLQTNTYEDNLKDSQGLKALYESIYRFPKVTIAQIEGHAIAGGCGLAGVCDFSFTIPEAKFGYTEVRIGFIPALVMVFLIRKIGESHARELLLTGKLISATEAAEIGLINFVVESSDIRTRVSEFGNDLCNMCSANSLQSTRQMMADIQEMGLSEALQYAAEMNAKTRASADCQTGIARFLDKGEQQW